MRGRLATPGSVKIAPGMWLKKKRPGRAALDDNLEGKA